MYIIDRDKNIAEQLRNVFTSLQGKETQISLLTDCEQSDLINLCLSYTTHLYLFTTCSTLVDEFKAQIEMGKLSVVVKKQPLSQTLNDDSMFVKKMLQNTLKYLPDGIKKCAYLAAKVTDFHTFMHETLFVLSGNELLPDTMIHVKPAKKDDIEKMIILEVLCQPY